jgi:gluconokinase
MIVVITGAAGAGKTTVGRALAAALRCAFYDADDLHRPEDIAQMARGEQLTDAQRQPWLQRVRAVIEAAAAAGHDAVVACSALRDAYRRTLADGIEDVRFVYLAAGAALLRDRLSGRIGHFAGVALLESQLATLEPPRDAIVVDAAAPVPQLVEELRRRLNRESSPR